ncbi:alpha/beta hydrolase [Arthrobacter sp. StoSoilA2]|uniref:alpha/beta fold hydrolase n=1 Tax=Arthrobacter sp. StoSoilA2 TaxID=2830990 RepID=UPI001CC4D914|nr:alpha/beta hydrolase [Arthrobacter sp. StoSoilA2]BCW35903.1 alpha/beta hydrolase [Arthrobacter sp. StoSoilA2]
MSIYPGVVSGTVDAAGATVRYYDGGQSGSGPVIVMVHGTGGRTDTHFFTLYPMLASRHRVIGVDMSDQTPGEEPLTVDHLAAQVRAVLDAVVPGRSVVLVGYSLGAATVAVMAAKHPELVEALVLVNGWAVTDHALRLRLSLWRRLYEQGPSEALAEYMMLNVYSRVWLNARSWTEIEQLRTAYQVGPGSNRMMELNSALDISSSLAGIQARTLVIGSTFDQLIPIGHSHELFGGITDARLAKVGSGHASVTERPAEIFHLIDHFVREPQDHPAGTVVGDDVLQQLSRL